MNPQGLDCLQLKTVHRTKWHILETLVLNTFSFILRHFIKQPEVCSVHVQLNVIMFEVSIS